VALTGIEASDPGDQAVAKIPKVLVSKHALRFRRRQRRHVGSHPSWEL
jgi:hypothetical protein